MWSRPQLALVVAFAACILGIGMASTGGALAIPPATAARGAITPQTLKAATAVPIDVAPGAPHYTTNVMTCENHGGDAATCEKLASDHRVDFYWSYACGGCRVTSMTLSPVTSGLGGAGPARAPRAGLVASDPRAASAASGPPQTFEVLAEPSSGWAGSCYVLDVVRADTGSQPESPKVCLGPLVQTTVLEPVAVRGFSRAYTMSNGNLTSAQSATNTLPFVVGNVVSHLQGVGRSIFNRAAFAFDRSAVPATATVFDAKFAYDAGDKGGYCFGIGTPAPVGWQTADWIAPPAPTDHFQTVFTYAKPTYQVDVQGLVAASKPGPLSFELVENRPAETNDHNLPGNEDCPIMSNVRLVLTTGVDR